MRNVVRVDAIAKADGSQKYVADRKMDGLLYAVLVRSSVPRAKVLSITLPELDEDYYYFDERDIPEDGKNELVMISNDWKCFAAGEVSFVGETIGILCGPDRNVLSRLKEEIKIEYEEQTPAVSIEDAIDVVGGAIVNDDNVLCSLKLESGENIDEAFAKADSVIEESFKTGYQEHVHLETNGAICYPKEDKFVVEASSQCPFYIRKSICGVIGKTTDSIIVKQTMTGGAFGGKEHFPDVFCGPLLLAVYKTKKPIQLVFTREEDTLFSVKRHPTLIKFKTALDKDGNILGMDSLVYYNAGRYLTSSYIVTQRGCMHIMGCYKFPAVRTKGFGMATNTFPTCAFRGFGAPQAIFAIETHMNHIAEKFGIDPLEYKKRYLIKQGDTSITNGKIVERVRVPELIDIVAKKSNYYEKVKKYKLGSGKGIGIALYNHGGAFTGNGESSIIKAVVKIKRNKDGKVIIMAGQTEMGQGIMTSLRKIAAKTLQISMNRVFYGNPDTSEVPDSGPTAASRSIMVPGFLVQKAAEKLKEKWGEKGEIEAEARYEHPDGYPWDQSTFQGYAYLGYGWGVCAVEIDVDMRTAEPRVVGIWSAHDVGNCIDTLIVKGQVNGGIAQGIGWASTENLENVKGYFKQHSMSDYIIPTSMDLPRQEVSFSNEPYKWGPFGAKGMGELVFNGSGAAYIDALSRAINRNIVEIPVPSEKVMSHILHSEKLAGE